MKRIKLRIHPDGSTTLVTIEGAGTGCTELASKLEKCCGDPDETTRAITADYYSHEESHQEQQQDVDT